MTRQPPSVAKPFAWRRLIPVLMFVIVIVAFFTLGLERYLSIDALRQHRSALRTWVETSGVLAVLVFMAVYTITVAFSLPGATVLSIASGFLFGPGWGTVIVIISATLGATALFSMAKTALGEALCARAGAWLQGTCLELFDRAPTGADLSVLRHQSGASIPGGILMDLCVGHVCRHYPWELCVYHGGRRSGECL